MASKMSSKADDGRLLPTKRTRQTYFATDMAKDRVRVSVNPIWISRTTQPQ